MKKTTYSALLLICSITTVTSYASPNIRKIASSVAKQSRSSILADPQLPNTGISDGLAYAVLTYGTLNGILLSSCIPILLEPAAQLDEIAERLDEHEHAKNHIFKGLVYSFTAISATGTLYILSGGSKLLQPNKFRRIPGRIGTAIALSAPMIAARIKIMRDKQSN